MSVRIIHIISSLRRGGRERQLATIASNTDFNKYPAEIIYLNESEENYIGEYNLADLVIKIRSRNFFLRLIELNKTINARKPDIIFTWGILESIFTILLKPFHNFRFINGSTRHGIRSIKLSHYLRTLILHLSKNVVSNSYSGLKANNLKRGKVLFNGIDEKFIITISQRQKDEKRKELFGIEEEKFILISVANLVPYKDYFSILAALKILKDEGYSFYYLILGDGPLRKRITNAVQNYKLYDHVKIVGNVANVSIYLWISDIFIHSSKGEGCSNAILEAMAAELPIIASDTGGTHEIVNSENGFLFEYKNTIQLSEYIKKCFINKKNRITLGRNSLKIVKEKYTVNDMMSNYYIIVDQAK